MFLKLACCDLWNDTLQVAGITHAYRLVSCSEKGSQSTIKRWFSDEIQRQTILLRISEMAAEADIVEAAMAERLANDAFRIAMANTPDLDSGEALLLALLSATDDPSVFVTGDKRCIGALRSNFPDQFARLKDRILSFERCLLMICEFRGAAYTIDRVRMGSNCDKTLHLALSDPNEFEAVLRSYDPLG